ncbi:MAG: ABC transporter permease [Actinomycetota bacterium]
MAVPAPLRLVEREFHVSLSLWRASAFSLFVAPVLVLLALGVGLGGLVEIERSELGGLEYLDFITPGLAVAGAVQLAAGGALWPVMAGHRWIGFYHAAVASPLRASDLFDGQVVFIGVRAALQSVALLGVAAALGGVDSPWGLLAVPVVAATCLAFAAPLAAFAAAQDTDAGFDVILRVVIVPLYLFSGTVFPLEQLPTALRVAVQLFPMTHGVELARAATTGSGAALELVAHAAVILAYVAVGWVLGRRAFARRLTP